MNAPLLVHVGYHKTGTTWLQTGLFRGPGFAAPWSSTTIREALVAPTAFTFDATATAAVFALGRDEAVAAGRVPVLSDERLSGSPHAGGHDNAAVAARLAAAFPDAHVLVVVREQQRAILSTYRQYVRDGGGATLGRYLAPRNPYEVPGFRWEHYDYHHLVGHYRRLFGDRLLVLAYEELARDPLAFAARVARFVDVEPPTAPPAGERYPSLSAFTLVLKRPFNRLFVRNTLSPAARFYVKDHERRFERIEQFVPAFLSRPLERRWRAELAALVGERYAASNREAAAMTGLDLEALGYPLAAGDGDG